MWDPKLNMLALAYRCVYPVLGGYLTARFAPSAPMRHVWIQAGIGTVIATAIPCLWFGGHLFTRSATAR